MSGIYTYIYIYIYVEMLHSGVPLQHMRLSSFIAHAALPTWAVRAKQL